MADSDLRRWAVRGTGWWLREGLGTALLSNAIRCRSADGPGRKKSSRAVRILRLSPTQCPSCPHSHLPPRPLGWTVGAVPCPP